MSWWRLVASMRGCGGPGPPDFVKIPTNAAFSVANAPAADQKARIGRKFDQWPEATLILTRGA
jgi:hypothetical protein